MEEQRLLEKQKLSHMLNDLQSQIKSSFNIVDNAIEKSVVRI